MSTELKIEYLPTSALKPYEKNARKHKKLDVDNIAKSIEKYGMNDAIGIWGKDNIIVEGHGRLEACKKLGIDTVPVVRLDHLTDDERREYAIAHNATAELSEWDLDILGEELAEINLSGFDFDFGLSGEDYSPDDFGDGFSLPNGDKPEICQMTFTLHEKQKELIEYAIGIVKENASETFGNKNANGNALYEVVRQWAEQRK